MGEPPPPKNKTKQTKKQKQNKKQKHTIRSGSKISTVYVLLFVLCVNFLTFCKDGFIQNIRSHSNLSPNKLTGNKEKS